jgi:hypothetical protein
MPRTGLDWRESGGEWCLWVLDEGWIDFLRAGGLAGTWERLWSQLCRSDAPTLAYLTVKCIFHY